MGSYSTVLHCAEHNVFIRFIMVCGEEMTLLEQEPLECFRCDLGFWDACFTTKTNCSAGERCYTGRGRAADVLDVKMLGCVRAEECEVVTRVEIFPNTTFYTMTRSCCDTDLCNTAPSLPLTTPLPLAVASLSAIFLAAPSVHLQ
ncbi:protein Bouncer-like [Osmerus mordax]|uniref:protein Bouncer-like n=1 Tax=Osmerus mordax TaxID=8014 RepID=UPI003510C10E